MPNGFKNVFVRDWVLKPTYWFAAIFVSVWAVIIFFPVSPHEKLVENNLLEAVKRSIEINEYAGKVERIISTGNYRMTFMENRASGYAVYKIAASSEFQVKVYFVAQAPKYDVTLKKIEYLK